MTALVRFQVSGYVRSQRALYPLVMVALLIFLILVQWPGGEHGAELTVVTFADIAAFMVPIWAWTARALLDTQPDVQRDLSTIAVGRRPIAAISGLLAAYGVNVVLGAAMLVIPVMQAFYYDVEASAMLVGVALQPLVAVPATLLGAWTSRAVIPSSAISFMVLLGGTVLNLLLSMGPLAWLSIPMIEWLRAAQDGQAAFTAAFPSVTLHIAAWSAVVAAAYILTPRRPA